MKKLATIAVLATGVLVLPAQAKPPHHPAHPNSAKSCTPHKVGYRAGGTLFAVPSPALSQTKGAGTATTSDDRYSGTITITLKKANHHATASTFTLIDAKVKFHFDRNNDGKRDATDLAPGDRVTLHGKITKLRHGCTQNNVTPTITVNNVDFNKPKPAKP
jgi:hypothetical protein